MTSSDMQQPLSRRGFVSQFSSVAGIDPDILAEFLYNAESIPGIFAAFDKQDLVLSCTLDGESSIPLLFFSVSDVQGASIYMRPTLFVDSLVRSGRLPVEANDYVDCMQSITDTKLIRYEDTDMNRRCYVRMESLFSDPALCVDALRRMMSRLSS